MSDVFISYSRKDIDFVRKLFNALERTGRDAWVDWEGIPYSVDWWQEICRGIDASDVFIFVVTPSSLTSHICNQELEYARANHKRIVPVMHIESDEKYLAGEWFNQEWELLARTNWDELKKINWLYFRVVDNFDMAFKGLLQAVEEDPEHLRYHTRLLVRAREWETSQQHNPELLLRGDELRRAENWLQFNADKNPPPTDSHRQFIEQSLAAETERLENERQRQQRELEMQRRAANRLRLFAISLVVFLIAAVGLALFAFDQQDRAEKSENEAQTQAAIAEFQADAAISAQATSDRQREEAQSLLWANAAQDVFNEEDDVALNLAVASARIDDAPSIALNMLTQIRYAPGRMHTLTGHSSSVTSVAFRPDGGIAVSGSCAEPTLEGDCLSGELIIWDVETWQPRQTLVGHTERVTSIAFSPDGRRLVSGSGDNTLIMWDVETWQLLRTLIGHTEWVTSVAFSADGRNMLSSSFDNTLIMWDVETGEPVQTWQTDHTYFFSSVAFAPDGRTVLSGECGPDWGARGCFGGEMIVWDADLQSAELGEPLHTLTDHEGWVTSVVYAPDGRTALSGSADSTLMLWDVETGERLRTLTGHTGGVNSVAISPDGRTALSGSQDQDVILWNLETGERLRTLTGHTGGVNSVAFSPDGRLALSGSEDGSVIVWDVDLEAGMFGGYRRTLPEMMNWVDFLAFSPDGRRAVSSSLDGYHILWNTDSETDEFGEPIQVLDQSKGVITFSPDGRTALSGSFAGALFMWDVESGKLLRTSTGHTSTVTSVGFSPDGNMAASGSSDGTLIVWDVETGVQLHTLTEHTGAVTGAVFNSASSLLWTVGASPEETTDTIQMILWDVETGNLVHSMEVRDATVFDFSPNGLTAISGSVDGTLLVWDLDLDSASFGQPIHTLVGHTGAVNDLVFSADGRTLISGSDDTAVIAWDLETGTLLRVLSGHTGAVTSVALSLDGHTVVSGSSDATLIVWDLETGALLRTLAGHTQSVYSVAVSPDGRTVLSGSCSDDLILTFGRCLQGELIIWQLETIDEMVEWLYKHREVHELTCLERAIYHFDPSCMANDVYPTRTPFITMTPNTISTSTAANSPTKEE